jgi:hypothetical protein
MEAAGLATAPLPDKKGAVRKAAKMMTTNTYTHYALAAMRGGELQHGMYSRSHAADTPEIARQLAKPTSQPKADAYALVRVETADDHSQFDGTPSRRLLRETIMEIIPR